ncbi:large ribosomal subunit protein uL15m isoform X2 [Meriones unguiculatus]|uniref:large ribosomal subunit protein uL15m isoform X2 n=1 Tax=Meriones unguiculatus TaxID=10047 RepID=UPI00293EEDA3|nr:large ribosomal subunit protein uL15m isoform X2 [Meriones unguiculatus]
MAGVVRGCGTSLDLLRSLPRVSLANLKPNPGSRKRERRPRDQRRGRKCGRGHKGERQRGTRPRLGFEGGQTPFYLVIPKYGFNEGHSFRHQYQPLSLRRLQYLIDLGRVDPTQPIDLTQLVNGRGVTIQPLKRDYGVQLVEEKFCVSLFHSFCGDNPSQNECSHLNRWCPITLMQKTGGTWLTLPSFPKQDLNLP